jgi:hypothetical protein
MQVFETQAEAIKHLAYIEWKYQPDVTVHAPDLKRGGFANSDGRFLSSAAAAGIAVAVKSEKGTQLHMAELVRQNFPGNASAALFAERIEVVAALPR